MTWQNPHGLEGHLISSQLGVFNVSSSTVNLVTLSKNEPISEGDPPNNETADDHRTDSRELGAEWGIYLVDEDEMGIRLNSTPVLTLQAEHRLNLIQISLDAVSAQAELYSGQDFSHHIRTIDDEAFEGTIMRGGLMLKEAMSLLLPGYCARLSNALEAGPHKFYDEYMLILESLNEPEKKEIHALIPNTKILMEGSIQHRSGSLLKAEWLIGIITELWHGGVRNQASRTAALRYTMSDQLLRVQSQVRSLPQADTHTPLDEGLYLDRAKISALPMDVANRVLDSGKAALIFDLLVLFIEIVNTSYTMSRAKRPCIVFPGGFAEMTRTLSERFGTATGHSYQERVRDACTWLNALQWRDTTKGRDLRFVSIERDSFSSPVEVTFLMGMMRDFNPTDRLVPQLDHPKGSTKGRALYNRLGWAIGLMIVERSRDHPRDYLMSRGLIFNDDMIEELKRRTGASRKRVVVKGLNAFIDHGALEIADGHMKLGPLNVEADDLIVKGAKLSRNASKRGQLAAEKKRKRAKSTK